MTNNISMDLGKVHYCSGCQMCAAVCPKRAICIELDEEGFYIPKVNQKLCNHCGLCVKSCYKFDADIQMSIDENNIDVYASYSKDRDILFSSTSGGIASHLVNECLQRGYKVVGVAYNNDDNIAVAEITDNFEDAKRFRGSKYMQAFSVKALQQIVEDDSNQKYAVFGTPCQIYALNKWAVNNNRREQFLFIDLFCHGCPSINLWQKYLNNIKQKEKIFKFDKIDFRSKAYGWHEFRHSFYKGDTRIISGKTNEDPFFTLFFDNVILGRSCYDCYLRSTLTYVDIRLGDFWGDEYDLNNEGVSAVVTITPKGKELFETIKPSIISKQVAFDQVIKAQSYGKKYFYNSEIRNTVIELLKSQKNMEAVLEEYLKTYSLKRKINLKLKKFVYAMPRFVRVRIKKIYHILLR